MLPIHKSTTDPLRRHRNQVHASYDNIPAEERTALKNSLLKEQSYLCSYCMARIDDSSMKIEHWEPQSLFPARELDYANLLAVCDGGEKKSLKQQHCDTKKGDSLVLFNPANPAHHARLAIRYTSGGEISSANHAFNEQMNTALNINLSDLKQRRKEVYARVVSALEKLPQNASKASIQQIIAHWETPTAEHKLPPFAGVAIYFLEKRLQHAH